MNCPGLEPRKYPISAFAPAASGATTGPITWPRPKRRSSAKPTALPPRSSTTPRRGLDQRRQHCLPLHAARLPIQRSQRRWIAASDRTQPLALAQRASPSGTWRPGAAGPSRSARSRARGRAAGRPRSRAARRRDHRARSRRAPSACVPRPAPCMAGDDTHHAQRGPVRAVGPAQGGSHQPVRPVRPRRRAPRSCMNAQSSRRCGQLNARGQGVRGRQVLRQEWAQSPFRRRS